MSGSLKVGLALVAAAGAGVWLGSRGPGEETRLTFLSVGQGDCIVFQTAGRTVLIDTGPNVRGNDAGERIVLPDLKRMGIDAIDLVLLSHPDMDHIGGLGSLLKGERIGTIAISQYFAAHPALKQHLEQMRCPAASISWLHDARVKIGEFTIEIDCPEWHDGEKDNDGSEFVRITGRGASAVFTGDASTDAERAMIPGHDWHAQVLKAGHHGSHTASSEEWIQAVHPTYAVISCGRGNSYGHPHQDVLDRFGRDGVKVFRTDRQGDVAFVVGRNGFEPVR